jgi:hypothetical protein
MKKLIAIFVIILSGFYAKSQSSPYINIDTSCIWVHDFHYYDGFAGFPFNCDGEVTTYIEKDTLINNLHYFKLITYPSADAISSSATRDWECKGLAKTRISYLYEDTLNNVIKRFVYDSISLQYNLQIGDTVKSHLNYTIDSITSEMYNGIARICRWSHLNMSNFKYRIIDGIGAELNFPISLYGEWQFPVYFLKCFKKNGVTLYPNNPVDSCIKKPLVPVGIKEWEKNLLVNFSSNQLTIQHANHKLIYSIFDLTGRKLISVEVNEPNYQKSFNFLYPSGIYILQIKNENHYLNQKIVIE